MGLPLQRLTLADFLAWEEGQSVRHEYLRGEIFAMVGGRRGHGHVVTKLTRFLDAHCDDTPCRVFSEGMKVQVEDEAILYPDVFVTCNTRFSANDMVFTEPVVIIEVLSPSTQSYDRSQKFAMYRRLSSLREYVLIDPDTRRVDVFRPQADGSCFYVDMTEVQKLTLQSIDFELPLSLLFKGMDSEEVASAGG